jgi:hypothetical protein
MKRGHSRQHRSFSFKVSIDDLRQETRSTASGDHHLKRTPAIEAGSSKMPEATPAMRERFDAKF